MSLPTIEESLGHPLNEKPARSYKKDLIYEDDDGYMRFVDNDMLVLNTDGSARRRAGRGNKHTNDSKSAKTRMQRAAARRQRMMESKADIKQRDLLKRLDRMQFDVVSELVHIYDGEETKTDQKLRILFKLAEHAFPKLSVLNTNSEQKDGFTFNISLSPEAEKKKKEIREAAKDGHLQ